MVRPTREDGLSTEELVEMRGLEPSFGRRVRQWHWCHRTATSRRHLRWHLDWSRTRADAAARWADGWQV